MEYSVHISCGNSRRKVEPIVISFGEIKGEGTEWTYSVRSTGKLELAEDGLEANSPFQCVTFGLAYLRQSLRYLKQDNPKMKFYEEFDGKLEEISIEDIFWTHDCVSE